MQADKKENLQKAIEKIANHLSRRSHSEKELRDKLRSHFPAILIDEAISEAKQKKWLQEPYELALQVKDKLDSKNKSWRYIKKYLESKGLPLPEYDRDQEILKIKKLLMKKTKGEKDVSNKLKLKSFLSYRLFEPSLISQVLESFFGD